jgi:zinc transport system permease protein
MSISCYLFGSILTVNPTELFLSLIIFIVVLSCVIFFYHDLFAVTFDEELAQSMGIKTGRINILLFILTAVVAVLAMKVTGIMLVSAMLILPPLTALQLSVSFRMTIIASVIFSILSVTGGIILSFLLNLPAGGTIVILNVIFLLIVFGMKKILPASR